MLFKRLSRLANTYRWQRRGCETALAAVRKQAEEEETARTPEETERVLARIREIRANAFPDPEADTRQAMRTQQRHLREFAGQDGAAPSPPRS